MSEKTNQKLVKCGCGGEALIETCTTRFEQVPRFRIRCEKCNISTIWDYFSEADVITAWNKAMSGSAEEKLKAFWDGMSAEMKEKRTAKVMNDGINYCENCEGYVEAPMAYCPYCGARLEWK